VVIRAIYTSLDSRSLRLTCYRTACCPRARNR
jgi:hypothetical protein